MERKEPRNPLLTALTAVFKGVDFTRRLILNGIFFLFLFIILVALADDGKPTNDEIALLIVHGVLHVLGHDHHEDHERQVMQARERALLEAHHR